jgi:hypothetical protein
MLASVLGRFDDAERHFTSALEQAEVVGARPYVADTSYQYAVALLRRGGPSDVKRAKRLLSEAGAIAAEIGLAELTAKIARAGA